MNTDFFGWGMERFARVGPLACPLQDGFAHHCEEGGLGEGNQFA
jgi:hypothetical protein